MATKRWTTRSFPMLSVDRKRLSIGLSKILTSGKRRGEKPWLPLSEETVQKHFSASSKIS